MAKRADGSPGVDLERRRISVLSAKVSSTDLSHNHTVVFH
jgi:hypothetical protein